MTAKMMPDVIPGDFFENQLAEYKTLQRELARLLTEKDHLVKSVGPQMEAELELKLGVLHFEVQSLESEIRRLKRKIELILHFYPLDGDSLAEETLQGIDAQLDAEFAAQRENTQNSFEKIVCARILLNSVLPQSDLKRMLKVYRSLAKKLHPEINPDLTAEYKCVWEYVSAAHRNGELEELETLASMVKSLSAEIIGVPDLNQPSAVEFIRSRIERLRIVKQRVREQLRGIKKMHPYRLSYYPQDAGRIDDQCRQTQERIRQLSKEKEAAEELLQTVLAGAGEEYFH